MSDKISSTSGWSRRKVLGTAASGIALAAAAGFPMPVLRYVVGASDEGAIAATAAAAPIRLLGPVDGVEVEPDSTARAQWSGVWGAAGYLVELVAEGGERLLDALASAATTRYDVPPMVRTSAGTRRVRWRVSALDFAGAVVRRSPWRTIRFAAP